MSRVPFNCREVAYADTHREPSPGGEALTRDISPVKSTVSPGEDTLYHLLPLYLGWFVLWEHHFFVEQSSSYFRMEVSLNLAFSAADFVSATCRIVRGGSTSCSFYTHWFSGNQTFDDRSLDISNITLILLL